MNSQSSHEPSGGADRSRGADGRSEARQAAQSALAESEQRYRTLFGTMAEGFALHEILCDGDGRPCDYRFLDVNPAFERQTGLKSADLVGRTVREVLPGIEPIWIERYGRVALTGRPEQFEAWSGALDRWYDVRAYQAAPGRFAALFTDITERKRSEQAVHSAALFPAQNPSPVLRVARNGILLYANPSSARLLKSWACKGGQRVPEEICRCVTEALDAKETAEMEVACGRVLYSFFVTPMVSEEYANLYGRDVTERRRAEKALHEAHERLQLQTEELQTANEELNTQAEELQVSNDELREQELALRESEERLRRSQEIAHLGSWELDLVHNRLIWSDEVYRIFGLKPQEFGATYEAFLAQVHPEDRAAVDAAYRDSLRDNRDAYEIEHRVICQSNGEIRIIHEKCQHFRDASGRILRSVGMVHDITERKRAQEQLSKLNRTLRALNNSSQALMRATEESAYLQEVCRIVAEDCGHAMVWIGYAEQDEAKSVRPVACAGFEEGYLETLRITWADIERGRGPTGTAIRTGQPTLCRDMLTDPRFAPWREQAVKRGYASSIVLPLLSGGRAFGALTIYSRQSDPFSEDDVDLLRELAADLAYGITSLRLRAAHARAEEAVRESEQRLRLALEGGGMGRWEWDLRNDTSFWDPRVYELLGLDLRVPAASGIFFQRIDPSDRDAVQRLVERSLAGAEDFHAEFRVSRSKGETPWLVSQGKVICDERGQAVRMMGVMYDVTQRKQMEADLRRLNDQLEEEVQAQTEELKDTIDRLEKEMTRRVLAEGDLRERSQMLEQRARQLQKLTLELSQAEDRERKRLAEILHDDLQQQLAAAKFHLSLLGRRIPQDPATQGTVGQLDQILKDAVEKSRTLSHELSPAVLYQGDLGESFEWLARQLKAKHGLAVEVESRGRINPSSEPLKIFLYKAAQEILFNVVKHACVKEVRLRVQRMHRRVWLTISDRGQGFDPRALGRTGGFGLLSIRERIELLGGRMKIRSAPGRGSTFLIAVPDGAEEENVRRKEGEKERREADRAFLRSDVPTFSPSSLHSDHRLRVLLVDDHKVMREGLASLLKGQSDLEVVGQAGNGREAVDLACQLGPDVVVMDAAMPLMAGDEATRQIKLHLPGVRVVALSMFEEADMAEAMRRAGAATYLLKTAPSDELLAAIRGTRV